MKKFFIACTCLLAMQGVFAKSNFAKKNEGVYIPLDVYQSVKSSNSYGESFSMEGNSYTVLCIKHDEVLSNVKFHDAYVIEPSEIDFSFKKKNSQSLLIDKVTGASYIKISDQTDYFAAYDKFLAENVVSKIKPANTELSLNDDGSVNAFGKTWYIDKDQWHYSDGMKIILYSKADGDYIGYTDEKFYTLKSGEDLQKVLSEEK